MKKREEAELRTAAHQKEIARYINFKVHNQTFEVGDLVLKRVYPVSGAFRPNWKGSYVVNQKLKDGTYKLTIVYGVAIRRA